MQQHNGVALSHFHVRHFSVENSPPILLVRKCRRDHVSFLLSWPLPELFRLSLLGESIFAIIESGSGEPVVFYRDLPVDTRGSTAD